MTNKELRKLGRRELLEMLITQSKELNRVKQELEEASAKLSDRSIVLANSGSIAEAALKLNKVFEAAQEAANQYLENLGVPAGFEPAQRETVPEGEGSQALLEQTRAECEEMRKKAEEECAAMREQTKRECEAMLAAVKDKCRQMEYTAVRRELMKKTTKQDTSGGKL